MKISVTKDELLEKLSNIQNIVEKRNTMPILSHFLLEADKKGSFIVATDLETALKEQIGVKVEKEGKICVPARKLFEIVREIEGDLVLELIDNQWLKIKTGASDFRLACLPSSEFPAWPALSGEDIEEIDIDALVLMEMIEKTIYSAGESDTRYTLNGLLFHTKPESASVTLVGTDGHRLALIMKQLEGEIGAERRIIMPRKAASEIRRFLDKETGKIKISIGKNHLLFHISSPSAGREIQFLTRLIEGTYPNYDNVIPQANEKKFFIKRDTFTKALRRISVMSRERANAIRFDIAQDTLVISSSNPDLGEAKEEVPIEYKGENLSIGFNARYLLDILAAMTSEKVLLELQDPLSPVLLKEEKGEDYRCVIMPMRI